jgi:hypothetical protein
VANLTYSATPTLNSAACVVGVDVRTNSAHYACADWARNSESNPKNGLAGPRLGPQGPQADSSC